MGRPRLLPLLVGLASACTTAASGEASEGNATSAEGQPADTIPDRGDYLRDVVQVESLGNASCALTSAGAVYCWGRLRAAAHAETVPLFGRGTGVPILVPGPDTTTNVSTDRIAMFGTAIAARRTNGELWIAGESSLASNQTSQRFLPSKISKLDRILRGTDPLCWQRSDDTVQCWSARAEALTEIRSLPAGVLLDENTANCLGTDDGVRCIGDGGGVEQAASGEVCPHELAPPGWLPLPSPPQRIVENMGHVCALTEAGSVHCTHRVQAERGNSADGTREIPQRVTTYEGPFVDVAIEGATGVCFATPEGRVQCQGRSTEGATGIVQLSAGYGHACGLREDGRVMCSGINNDGQLGSGGVSGGLSMGPPSRVANFVVAPAHRQAPVTQAVAQRKPAGQWVSGAPRVACEPTPP